LGRDHHLLIGDIDADVLKRAAETLTHEGYKVTAQRLDVADRESVNAFAKTAAGLGELKNMVLTAGLSPRMADAERILAVNMLGTIHVMDAFLPLATRGTVGVIIASNSAYFSRVPEHVERKLALDPPETLVEAVREVQGWDTGLGAYWLAKRCNQLRVEAAAFEWGKRGARIVSISPGVMTTPMVHFERGAGAPIDEAIDKTPAGRGGRAEDIAGAIEWLVSPQASFVTGSDLLIDGGMASAFRWSVQRTEDPQDRSRQAV